MKMIYHKCVYLYRYLCAIQCYYFIVMFLGVCEPTTGLQDAKHLNPLKKQKKNPKHTLLQ